jgi:hypothetical protein
MPFFSSPEQHPSQFVTHQLADGYKFAITRSCDVARTGEVFCDDPLDPDVPTETPLGGQRIIGSYFSVIGLIWKTTARIR